MSLQPGEHFGRYVIEERLGAGGMGEVFQARDTKLERRVALKVLRGGLGTLDTEGAARILREARAAAAINHANAVTIHDVGEVGDVPFIAMELVEGRSLRAYVGDGTIAMEQRIAWLLDVARALAAAHAKRLVHRDVKPENVMIREADRAVKVLDFGIARQAAGGDPSGGAAPTLEPITKDGAIAGTPTYMAPEQLRNQPLDGRTDQFAWGTMAFELLTGSLPWQSRAGSLEVVAEILHAPAASPRERDAAIPDTFGSAVKRAMAKRPEDRFASMEALIDHVRVHAVSPLAATEMLSNEQVQLASGAAPIRKKPTFRASLVVGAAALAAGLAAIVFAPKIGREAASSAPASATVTSPAAPPQPSYSARLLVPRGRDRLFGFTVSSDATEVAYREADDIWFISVATGARARLPLPDAIRKLGNGYDLELMPDGRLLLGWYGHGALPLVLVARDGSFVTTRRQVDNFSVSPDGKSVAWAHGGTLYVGDLDGTSTTAVTQFSELSSRSFSWSPDSKRFAFVRVGSGGPSARLETLSADGRESRVILQSDVLVDKNGAASVTWTGADTVAYVEYDAVSTLREQRLDSGGAPVGPPRTLWESATLVPESVVSSRGRFFFTWAEAKDDVEVARMKPSLDGLDGDLVPITPSGSAERSAGWLPDGRALFTSDRDGPFRVFAQSTKGGQAELLLSREQAPAMAWGATGTDSFAAFGREGDALHIFRTAKGVTADLGAFVGVDAGEDLVPCTPCVEGPPARCAFEVAAANDASFFSVDPLTGAVSPPFAHVAIADAERRCALSPDGATIAMPTHGGFLRIGVRDGAQREILLSPHLEDVQFARPLPGGEHYFVSGMGFGDEVYAWLHVDATGHATPIRTSKREWMFAPLLAPNRRDVAVTVRGFEPDLWMLEPTGPK